MVFRTITGGTEDSRGRIVGCTVEGIIRGDGRVRVEGDRHDDDEQMTRTITRMLRPKKWPITDGKRAPA